MVTETTISPVAKGWDPNGRAEFGFATRKALQYAGSIDEYTKIMLDGNNGGYANDWLIGDRKTNEVAQLELGLEKAYKAVANERRACLPAQLARLRSKVLNASERRSFDSEQSVKLHPMRAARAGAIAE